MSIEDKVSQFEEDYGKNRGLLIGCNKDFFGYRVPSICRHAFLRGKARILVCGNTSHGKSTFVSKLSCYWCNLRRSPPCIFPVHHFNVCTKFMWKIGFGHSNRIIINGSENRPHEESVPPLNEYKNCEIIGEKTSSVGNNLEDNVDFYKIGSVKDVHVQFNNEQFRKVEITDSPGMSTHDFRRVITSQFQDYDMIIYATSVHAGEDGISNDQEEDIRNITRSDLFKLPGRVMFFVTYMDRLFLDGNKTNNKREEESEGEDEDEICIISRQEELQDKIDVFKEKFVRRLSIILKLGKEYVRRMYPIFVCSCVDLPDQVQQKFSNEKFAEAAERIQYYLNGAFFDLPAQFYVEKMMKAINTYFFRYKHDVLVKKLHFSDTKLWIETTKKALEEENVLEKLKERIKVRIIGNKKSAKRCCCLGGILGKDYEEGNETMKKRLSEWVRGEVYDEYNKVLQDLDMLEKMKLLEFQLSTHILGGIDDSPAAVRKYLAGMMLGGLGMVSLGYALKTHGIIWNELLGLMDKRAAIFLEKYKMDDEDTWGFLILGYGISYFSGLMLKIIRYGEALKKVGVLTSVLTGGPLIAITGSEIQKRRKDPVIQNFRPESRVWREDSFEQVWGFCEKSVFPKYLEETMGSVQVKIQMVIAREKEEMEGFFNELPARKEKWRIKLRELELAELNLLDLDFRCFHEHNLNVFDDSRKNWRGVVSVIQKRARMKDDEETGYVVQMKHSHSTDDVNSPSFVWKISRRIRFMNMARQMKGRFKTFVPLFSAYKPKDRNVGREQVFQSAIIIEENPNEVNLWDLLFDDESKKLTNLQKFEVMIGVTESLKEMHGLGVIHRDLRPDCFLVDRKDFTRVRMCMFGDYGFGEKIRRFRGKTRMVYTDLSLYCKVYFSKEMNVDEEEGEEKETSYGLERDIFSLGVILAQIWNSKFEVLSWNYGLAQKEVMEGEPPVFTELKDMRAGSIPVLDPLIRDEDVKKKGKQGVVDGLKKLLFSCTSLDPTQRMKCVEVLDELIFLKDRFQDVYLETDIIGSIDIFYT